MSWQPHKNPYQFALHLITRWPGMYEEIAYPQAQAFAARTLAIADPSRFVEAVYQLIRDVEDGQLDRDGFDKALDELIASYKLPG